MKWLVIAILPFATFKLHAARDGRQLIRCLGEEEKKFHLKKDTGPEYDLNQRLISEMLQIPAVDVTAESYNHICRGPQSPSWKLLETSIDQGKNIFKIPASVTGTQRSITAGMVDDYIEATREILLTYISQVQALSPTPTCLKEEIPPLDNFFSDIKYLQEDVEIKKIFAGRDLKIFERLKDYPAAFQRCRERLKKKLKSASKEAPKNS